MRGKDIIRAHNLSDVFAISETVTITPAVMRYFKIMNSIYIFVKIYLYFSQPAISGIVLQCSRIASLLFDDGDIISEDIIVLSSIDIE